MVEGGRIQASLTFIIRYETRKIFPSFKKISSILETTVFVGSFNSLIVRFESSYIYFYILSFYDFSGVLSKSMNFVLSFSHTGLTLLLIAVFVN